MNATSGRESVRHALVGHPDDTTMSEAAWPAYSAGYEAGLRAGVELSDLRISVELVPVGPAHAGLKLWRAVTTARLNQRAGYRLPALTPKQLREQARTSWSQTTTPATTVMPATGTGLRRAGGRGGRELREDYR